MSWIMRCNFCRRWLMNQIHHLTILASKEELNKLDQTCGQKVSHYINWRIPFAISLQVEGGFGFEYRNPVVFLVIVVFQIQLGFCSCLFKKHFPIVCNSCDGKAQLDLGVLVFCWDGAGSSSNHSGCGSPCLCHLVSFHYLDISHAFDMWYKMVAFGSRWGNEASQGHRTLAKGKLWKMNVTRLFRLLS